MVNLEMLQVSSCDDLNDVRINAEDKGKQGFISSYSMALRKFCKLHEVHIISCSKLLNLTWLIYALCLQSLAVISCESVEEVIDGSNGVVGENSDLFSRLTTLQLENLQLGIALSFTARVVLFECLREEYPEVLGSLLEEFKAIVNVIGMTKMTPPIKDLLPGLTPILKNRHEKVQENCIDLVGRIADRGAEFVPAREWMRICFEILEMLKAHKKGIP